MDKPILPVIAGPTASGKTACAVALCHRLNGEVVSADSMQLYRGMDILSAKPTAAEMDGVPHHMLGCVDPAEKYSADAFREAANACIADIIERGRMPVLCGGTGLYINAVTRPMSFSMESDPVLHARLLTMAEEPGGKRRLHDTLREIDPDAAARLHENDVRRVARAIEVYRLTGMTQTEHSRIDQSKTGDYREMIFCLDWPRDALYSRIDARVDAMLEAGLVDEVRSLLESGKRHPTAEQAIGYKEIAAALQGRATMNDAIYWTKQASRNLAKRQLTWFRRDPRVIWIKAEGESAASIASQILDKLIERFGGEVRCL